MNILFIAEQQNVITGMLSALHQSEGSHQSFTAACFNSARAIVEEIETLDALVTVTFTSDGSNAFDLRDELTRKFPGLKAAFLNNHDLSGWTQRLGRDTVLSNPPEKNALLKWLEHSSATSTPEETKPLPGSLKDHSLPLMLETIDENDEDLPIAETVLPILCPYFRIVSPSATSDSATL